MDEESISKVKTETNEKNVLFVNNPEAFDFVGDMIDCLNQRGATHTEIKLVEKVNLKNIPVLILFANCIITKPKKFLRKKTGVLKAWQGLGDTVVLVSESQDEESDARYNMSMSSVAKEFASFELGKKFHPLATSTELEFVEAVVMKIKDMYKSYKKAACNGTMIAISLKKTQPKRTNKYPLYLKSVQPIANKTDKAKPDTEQKSDEGGYAAGDSAAGVVDILSRSDNTPFLLHLNASLRDYLQVFRLIPRMHITLQGAPIINQLWMRSLRCTETLEQAFQDEDQILHQTRGVSHHWPLHSAVALYSNSGRLINLTTIRNTKNSLPKCRKIGLIYPTQPDSDEPNEVDVPNDVLTENMLQIYQLGHSLHKEPDEHWLLCKECCQWRHVSPNVEAEHFTCAKIDDDASVTCETGEADLYPEIGKFKPKTPGRARRATPRSAATKPRTAAAKIRLGSPGADAEEVPKKKARNDSSNETPRKERSMSQSPHKLPSSAKKGYPDQVPTRTLNFRSDDEDPLSLTHQLKSPLKSPQKSPSKSPQKSQNKSPQKSQSKSPFKLLQQNSPMRPGAEEDESAEELRRLKHENSVIADRERELCTLIVKYHNAISNGAKIEEGASSERVITELKSTLSNMDADSDEVSMDSD